MIPTVTSVVPAIGPTGGGQVVTVNGTNFQLWQIPPANGRRSGPVWPTVRVRFGGVAGSNVQVVSPTKLFVRPPMTPLSLDGPAYGEGSVTVEVSNVDSDGNVIPGEVGTRAAAYAYRRVQLALNTDLNRLIHALTLVMRAQIIGNVSISTHTDYDPDVGDGPDTVGIATLPGIALLGPKLIENRFYSLNAFGVLPVAPGVNAIRREPYTVDVAFQILGISNKANEAVNLMTLVQSFFNRNKSIAMPADPSDPSKGEVVYDMDWMPDGDLEMDSTPNEANIRSFVGRFVIFGFDIEDLTGFLGSQEVSRTSQIVEDLHLVTEQKALEET